MMNTKNKLHYLSVLITAILSTSRLNSSNAFTTESSLVSKLLWAACTPITSIDVSEIKFSVYTYENSTTPTTYPGNASDVNINLSRTTKFIIHGWTENGERQWIQNMTQAYYTNGFDNNVVVVDWSSYGNHFYFPTICYVPYIGEAIGSFIVNIGFSLDKVHIIGHSLGGQVAGYAGQVIYTITEGKKVGRITGLDAAGPLYCTPIALSSDRRLSADDANFVDSIHTNEGEYGCNLDYGTVNFRPNCGKFQTGCENYAEEGATSSGYCSHYRSYKYYTESIYNNCFTATTCNRCDSAFEIECTGNVTTAEMGEFCSKDVEGNYYLSTNSYSPFCITS